MALLSDDSRSQIKARYQRHPLLARPDQALALTKPELAEAIAALDAFADQMSSVARASLPKPASAVLTDQQLAVLTELVLQARYGVP